VKDRVDESTGIEELLSARSQANPGARLLEAARELFNEQGYAVAGINEIIARSSTSKKSFYNYFPSKKKLGEACLRAEERDLFRFLDDLSGQHRRDYRAFARAWARSIKRAARAGEYRGCPISNTAAQALAEFRGPLQDTVTRWSQKLATYLANCDLKMSPAHAEGAARLILMQYEGAVQMWRLSGETQYFDRFEEMLYAVPELTAAPRRRSSR
jgi:AcrR family transcriptional regulator